MKRLWLALLPVPALAASPVYVIRDLGPSLQPGGALYWRMHPAQSCPENLPTFGGDPARCHIYAVYSGDFFVGDAPLQTSGGVHALFWLNNGMTDLGVLPDALPNVRLAPSSTAYAANNFQEIVGVSDSAALSYSIPNNFYQFPARHAVLWTNTRSDPSIHDLGSLAGERYDSLAWGVNDSHEIVGWTNTIATADGSVLQRAFLYTGGTMYNLSFYLLNASNIRLTEALAINCEGDISAIGYDRTQGDAAHPRSYLLTRQGKPRTCP